MSTFIDKMYYTALVRKTIEEEYPDHFPIWDNVNVNTDDRMEFDVLVTCRTEEELLKIAELFVDCPIKVGLGIPDINYKPPEKRND